MNGGISCSSGGFSGCPLTLGHKVHVGRIMYELNERNVLDPRFITTRAPVAGSVVMFATALFAGESVTHSSIGTYDLDSIVCNGISYKSYVEAAGQFAGLTIIRPVLV